jgi:1-aminocyclopropane-1-carboxylate deaminase/D-cysteine desulfhydrase-like pyridoxal-dependent ACC family enzyme
MVRMNDTLANLAGFPQLVLAEYPTPLEYLPRLSIALRRPVYFKRDDQIGPALGGNKTRKLAFLLADAQRQGAKQVVTFGGLQSNHARITAAAARKNGMLPHLFYFERRPMNMTGNLLLAELLGAQLHFIPFGGGGGMTIERANRLVQLLARMLVGKHYFVPVGGHNWLGCLGYVQCAYELAEQTQAMNIGEAHVICAAGTGGTLAGLMLGFALAAPHLRPLAIDVGRLWRAFPSSIAAVANQASARLGCTLRFTPAQVPLIEGRYVGQGYAIQSEPAQRAMALLAQLEGVVLDPIYTGKAFAGMLDLAQTGQLGRTTPLIFVHSGGTPGLFAGNVETLKR